MARSSGMKTVIWDQNAPPRGAYAANEVGRYYEICNNAARSNAAPQPFVAIGDVTQTILASAFAERAKAQSRRRAA